MYNVVTPKQDGVKPMFYQIQEVWDAQGVGWKRPCDMIEHMADLENMLTTQQAYRLAMELGDRTSRVAITQAAKRGAIKGAVKLGAENSTSGWLLPREEFLEWLRNHQRWRKTRPTPP